MMPETLYDEFGTPVQDDAPQWSPEVALRIDLQSLESVFNMEEKITNASMQNKVSIMSLHYYF